MSTLLVGKQQVRCFSRTTPAFKHHARRQNKKHYSDYFHKQVDKNPANRRFHYRPGPLTGNSGLWNAVHEDHPWDLFHNPRPTSTFSERGIALFKLLPHNARVRNFIFSPDLFDHQESTRIRLYTAKWSGNRSFFIPMHLLLPPGHRPMTEWPTSKHREYDGWMDFPHVRRQSPITNTPDLLVKHASDKAKKMELMKVALAASNFRVGVRAKWESRFGAEFRGPGKDHNVAHGAPSPLWQWWGARHGGEVFARGAGPGTFPRPDDHRD
ncbi:hypothetical protein DIPPA_04488 [Diplonema papillatum]|nr:hypothetical protein DIPPA_04488 [Diplonema papillatum]